MDKDKLIEDIISELYDDKNSDIKIEKEKYNKIINIDQNVYKESRNWFIFWTSVSVLIAIVIFVSYLALIGVWNFAGIIDFANSSKGDPIAFYVFEFIFILISTLLFHFFIYLSINRSLKYYKVFSAQKSVIN